jgi:antitoxin (DNA-binding transcriptional repressor) of toxin-antitoxin stability system
MRGRIFPISWGAPCHGKETVIIRRHNRPVAALVPIEDLKLLEALEEERDAPEFREARRTWIKGGRRSMPIGEVAKKLGVKL